MNDSDESGSESAHYSNDDTNNIDDIENESVKYEKSEDEEDGEIQDSIQEKTHIMTDKKRKKVIDDVIDSMPKKKKKLHSDLYKPPTAEELNQLRETENLFHSNLFRLQIEEMLNEIRIKDKYKRLLDSWFQKLEKTINEIKETEEYQVSFLT